MKTLKIKAPAKVNYRLDVLGKRADGYHDLRMIMQRIDLCDEIEISMTNRPELRVACGGTEGIPSGQGNIAWRAADALLQFCGKKVGFNIAITKNIPVAAGLGGGSSDAAAVMMGINELLKLGLSDEQLMEVGVKVGADVPFFIFKKTALAEGIGEKLSAVDGLPPAWLVLVNPNMHVSTAWVYQNLPLTKQKEDYKLPQFCGKIEDICALLSNDLEIVTIQRFPVIQEIKEKMLSAGACGVLMSGSGPTVFGVFGEEEKARQVHAQLSKEQNWFVAVVKTL